MARPDACPDEARFQSALRGQAAQADIAALASHLEGCPSCAERLDRGLAGNTLLEAMRGQATVVELPNDPALLPLVERLLQLSSPSNSVAAKNSPAKSATAKSAIGKSLTGGIDLPSEATQAFVGAAGTDPLAERFAFLSPPQAADEIGRLGTYRVLKVLGAGGMGVVFQAEDMNLKRKVALKVMRPEASALPTARDRFLREAQAAARVEHEHVVTIHQVGEVNGVPFLAMPWLKGQSLDEALKRLGTLKPAQAVRVARQIALGLAAAHEHGLIHRDIKPANIWLEAVQGGRVKILDFGLARAEADEMHLTQTGSILGTPAFMAPEQASGANVDQRCDLFSLGVVMYRMVTGLLPFRGESTMAILMALATVTPPTPQSLNAAVPAELSDLIMQLLAKNPADRPATAREVADRLLAIGRQMTATQTSVISKPAGSEPSSAAVSSAAVSKVAPAAAPHKTAGPAAAGITAQATLAPIDAGGWTGRTGFAGRDLLFAIAQRNDSRRDQRPEHRSENHQQRRGHPGR